MTTEFTPVLSSVGGALIGLSAAWMLLSQGRIAGISGIFGGLLKPIAGDTGWRFAFVGGLLAGGALLAVAAPDLIGTPSTRGLGMIGLAGVLVGVGTRLGNGCTSGHGVCGISRLSPRSIVATVTFMTTGALSVALANAWIGGAS